MNYIGIDIGDGESCVCYLPAGSDIEPRPLTLTGKQSFISAVAENERGETLIGMDAVHAPQVRRFSVRFKSRYLQSSPETLQDTPMYTKEALKHSSASFVFHENAWFLCISLFHLSVK